MFFSEEKNQKTSASAVADLAGGAKRRIPVFYQWPVRLRHSTTVTGALSGGADKARKAFFSEEKKQKTFAISGVCAARKVRDSIR